MYNKFADDVRNNAEIFEEKIQNAKEMTTKAIDKVNAKLNNDTSVLKFNGQSLKDAKVIKFIFIFITLHSFLYHTAGCN